MCVNGNYHHVIYGIQMEGCILIDMSLTKLWNNLETPFVCSIYVIGYKVHFNGYMPDQNCGILWIYTYKSANQKFDGLKRGCKIYGGKAEKP